MKGHLAGTACATTVMALLLALPILSSTIALRPWREMMFAAGMVMMVPAPYCIAILVLGALPAWGLKVTARRLVLRHPAWPIRYGDLVGLLLGGIPSVIVVYLFERSDEPLVVLLQDPRVIGLWHTMFIIPGAAWGAGWWWAEPNGRQAPPPRIDIAATRS
ncbi:hypothetical protein [Xanthobacter autotrophicus]|uniref:hypothetical protein n=1 Tax=Xanthobacter autotrophicus TaxID=280 RepID=UPI00372CD2B7